MIMLQHMARAAPLGAASLKLDRYSPAACRDWTAYAVDLLLNGVRRR